MGNQQVGIEYLNQGNTEEYLKENVKHGVKIMKKNTELPHPTRRSLKLHFISPHRRGSLFSPEHKEKERSLSSNYYTRGIEKIVSEIRNHSNGSAKKKKKLYKLTLSKEKQPSTESLVSTTVQENEEEALSLSFIDDVPFNQQNDINNNNHFTQPIKPNNLRFSYFTKLVATQNWNIFEQNSSPFETKIIFDWDDLFQSSLFLAANQLYQPNASLSLKDSEKFVKVEFNILRLLTTAIEKGKTYIITNSNKEWINYSINKFYPSLEKIKDKISIASAKEHYENIYKGDPKMWKFSLFKNIVMKEYNKNNVYNILYFGDMNLDRKKAKKDYANIYMKNIRIIPTETLEMLNKQLDLICKEFTKIYALTNNITMKIDKKVL